MPYLVLAAYRENPSYNDIVGKAYHFPRKYISFFDELPLEFVYYEPARKGPGTYFGKGIITARPFEDRTRPELFFVEIDSYEAFPTEVPGPMETGSRFYNPQNAVRYLEEAVFRRICHAAEAKEGNHERTPIRFNPHIFRLLGDQLISREDLAVFELVKNSYDADATKVDVVVDVFSEGDSELEPCITVADNGSGMTLEAIRSGWLTVGGSVRRGSGKAPSPVFGRLPLGEKGIGRLAAFKLGDRVSLSTRAKGGPEYHVTLDIGQMTSDHPDSDPFSALVETADLPLVFEGESTGTVVEVSKIRKTPWTRGQVRSFKRTVETLRSPFSTPDAFDVSLRVPPEQEGWLEGIPSLENILGQATWVLDFSVSDRDGKFAWRFGFHPSASLQLGNGSFEQGEGSLALLPTEEGVVKFPKRRQESLILKPEELTGIGPLKGKFHIFYRRDEILGRDVRRYLDEQVGIRVYRDGIRVYDYGEKGNDWLGLDSYRINLPGQRLGNNSVVGMVELELSSSHGLQERTNREGFDNNDAFSRLRHILLSVVDFLDRKRLEQRKKLDEALKGRKAEMPSETNRFEQAVAELEAELKNRELLDSLATKLETIRSEYMKLREVMLQAGMAGLNLALIFHEVERSVITLRNLAQRKADLDAMVRQIEMLVRLLDGFSGLFKKNLPRSMSAKNFFRKIRELNEGRLRYHKVDLICPLLDDEEEPDVTLYGAVGLCLGAVNNLMDNALYWTRLRREETPDDRATPTIALLAEPPQGTSGARVIVADNGTGFRIDTASACEPFVTERPGGMGLGLYYARLVMEMQGGRLSVQAAKDCGIPGHLDGAAVILEFGKESMLP